MPFESTSDSYKPFTGLVYLFNLIVGTGALTMPAAFLNAGWIMSLIIVVLLCFVSFVTTTYVIESMSVANAVVKSKTVSKVTNSKDFMRDDSQNELRGNVIHDVNDWDTISEQSTDREPLIDYVPNDVPNQYQFDITQRIEMGAMASLFFNKIGIKLFYVCIAAYLYGDLAIYGAAIAKSMRDVTCNYKFENCNATGLNDQCWSKVTTISRTNAYRIYLAVTLLVIGPFAYFNLQKTKYLQILTSFFRWSAFISMIILGIIVISRGKNTGKPKVFDLHGVPNLFGVCVYSFMCHHSLPGVLTPINPKKNLRLILLIDYALILTFYCLLSFTGIFAFSEIQDIYTLNFQLDKCSPSHDDFIHHVPFLDYFLPLFPVFTLSTNFPIIAITLTNNLRTLFLKKDDDTETTLAQYNRKKFIIQRILFPSLAVLPPFALAFATEDLQVLVGIVGSYAGATIQYIIPAFLVYSARKSLDKMNSDSYDRVSVPNYLKSPFSHKWWVWIVMIWSVICIILVTVDHILEKKL